MSKLEEYKRILNHLELWYTSHPEICWPQIHDIKRLIRNEKRNKKEDLV